MATLLASGCSDPPDPGTTHDESAANGIECDVPLDRLEAARIASVPVLEPTSRKIRRVERFRHLNEIARMPNAMIDAILARGIRIELTGGTIVEFPQWADLKGQVPRGWNATAYTWDDVPGTATASAVYLGDSAKPNNAASLAVHEATHAIDRALGGFSTVSVTVSALYQAELARPPALADRNSAYRRSHPEEFLAVAVEEYVCSAKTRARLRALYPDVFDYVSVELSNDLRARLTSLDVDR